MGPSEKIRYEDEEKVLSLSGGKVNELLWAGHVARM
jgi:hypothetical protein